MGIGPQGLGSAGMKKGVHGCGTPMNKLHMSPLPRVGDTCWDGYEARGKKKSPSGKRTASGRIKMVNNCVKVSK
tara:strand:- start:146 stop:367 length:222 start_codon:yes stop_codon:yes gene_type:complete